MLKRQGLLLVLPVPFRIQQGRLFLDAQACNGLARWADNFSRVIVAAPLIPEAVALQDEILDWQDIATLERPERFEILTLPWAYSIGEFRTHYASTRKLLAAAIHRSQYLQFAISSLWGDWAAIAALEAKQQKRPYAIHTDLVDYKVIEQVNQDKPILKRFKAKVLSLMMQQYHQWIIRRADLGLWHGEDCYRAYSPFCTNSYLIHDVHTKAEDSITPNQLVQKLEQVNTASTLRICYAGRIATMKAPLDWVRAIAHAKQLGANLEAVWFGEGPLRDQMTDLIAELGAEDYIDLAGFEADRPKLLQQIRDSHIMPFTHISAESPRCLLESLICGTPIVGYHSLYAEDLLKGYDSGLLVPTHDWRQLGEQLKHLTDDRPRLAQLIQQAAANGSRFNDAAVFRERSRLIIEHLAPVQAHQQAQELVGAGARMKDKG